MELLILLFMFICIVATLRIRTKAAPLLLGLLSINIIASFAILMSSKGLIAIPFFIIILFITPWVTFSRLKDGVPYKCEKANNTRKTKK